jgi:PAS domain S-box-containing protein
MLRDVSADEFELVRVDRLEPALERLGHANVDVVLLDLGLPDSVGWATFERTRQRTANEPIVVISGLDDEELALQAVRSGAQDYLVKGRIEGQLLARVLRYAIERTRAEATLRWLTLAVEQSPAAVFITDPQGTIEYVNATFTEVTGYAAAEAVGQSPRILKSGVTPPEHYRELWATIRRGDTWRSEIQNRRKNGELYWDAVVISAIRDARGTITHFLSIQEDVTERKHLQARLLQAQKMEAVGRLAGGVAHDFNNILTAIFGYLDFITEELPPDSPARADLDDLRTAATRAASLTRQLLAFSRQQVLQPVVLNLNDVVENIEKMLNRLLGEDVEVRTVLAGDLGNVRADAGQIEQVILNLAVNARDAMPTGGKLTIETANADLSSEYVEAHRPVVPGRYAMVAVSDTGTGMDQATQARLFEPFFTTKEKGKGTGLGLATVYGIVKQSGGYIWAYSEPGRGTAFKVYLPRVDAPVEPAPPPHLAGTPAGTETVLLAEDDDLLRPLARELLKKLGYTVLDARHATDALAVALRHEGPIHLLVSDVVMPGESGLQLARHLIERHPTLRVLYMSGYTDEAIVRHGLLDPGVNYLQKPFTPAALARKIREVLDGK